MVWGLLLVAFSLVAATNWRLRDFRPSFLAPQFTYTSAAFHRVLNQWSEQQLTRYRRWLLLDSVTLGCYGAFGFFWVSSAPLFNGLDALAHIGMQCLLPFAAVTDALENGLHLYFTRDKRPRANSLAYTVAGLASTAKFLGIAAFAIVALCLA
jgi:hypothetical protein